MSWLSKQMEKERLKKLYFERPTRRYKPSGVMLSRRGVYFRLYPYSMNHGFNRKKYYQKMSNRILRRRLGNEETLNRGKYKRIFDMQWNLY